MKKLMLPLFAVLLFTACKNTTPPPVETQTTPAELKIDPAQIKDASAKAKTLAQNMKTLLDEVNAAGSTMKGAKKTELEAIGSQLNDVMAKEDMMAKGIEAAENAGGSTDASSALNSAAPPPGVLQDYIQSIDSYSKFVEELRSQFEALKSGTAPKK